MKRRDFIKAAGTTTLLPLALNGFPIKVAAKSALLNLIQTSSQSNGRVMVLIQLNGGNDGLNTLIPLDQYSALSSARTNVLIPENKVLKLTGTDKTGFHPEMAKMRELYDDGKISIVQDVGYPNPDFSHFRSTDIWMAGSGSETFLKSGWAGRMLEHVYDDYPDGYPNAEMPDPPAIQIGFGMSLTLLGNHGVTGMALSNPDVVYKMLTEQTEDTPNTPAGHELKYISLVAQQTEAYSIAVKAAAEKASNLSPHYADNNNLAQQLKLVARLIAGGLKTPVYVVTIGGFDTHAKQVLETDTTKGTHADLLKSVSDAVFAFQDDCIKLGIGDKVCAMTFSEFGRRIISNASYGTDHGTAAPMFVFGTKVNPGIIGDNPIIPQNVMANNNLPMQYDYRQVYWTMMKDWFQIDDSAIKDEVLYDEYGTLPIFKQNLSVDKIDAQNLFALNQNYPNPFNDITVIDFVVPGGLCILNIYDSKGRLIETPLKEHKSQGKHSFTYQAGHLKQGYYYCQLITPVGRTTKRMMKL
jgi:uncharacterized protein (DUF1501 family)